MRSRTPPSPHRRSVLRTALGLLSVLPLGACNQGSHHSSDSITSLRTFATTYGTKGDDCILDVEPTFDFGRIVAGTTDPLDDGRGDGWLMKQDIDGNVEWSQAYGDRQMDLSGNSGLSWDANEALDSNQIDLVADDQGGCVVVGGRYVGNVTDDRESAPVFHPVAIRLDRDGRVVWRVELPGDERGGRFLDVEKAEWSDDYFAVGYTEKVGQNLDHRNRDALVVSLSGDGEVRWQHSYGDESHEVVTGIDFVSAGRGAPPYALTLVGNRTITSDILVHNVGVFQQIENSATLKILVNEIVDEGGGVNLLDVQREPFTQDFQVVGVVKDDRNHYYTGNDNSFDLLLAEFDATNGSRHYTSTFEVAEGFNAGDLGFALAPGIGDRGLYAVGYGGVLSRDALLASADGDGNFDRGSSHTYGTDATNEEFHAILRTITQSYLVAGKKDGRAWAGVIGFDANFEWDHVYDVPGGDGHGQACAESFLNGNATGYFVAGTGPAGGWVLCLDRSGGVRWTRSVHDDTRDEIHAVRQTDDDGDGLADDGYLAVGTTGSSHWQETDAWLLKVDAKGEVEWQRSLGRHDLDDTALVLEPLPSDGFVVAGSTESEPGACDLFFQAFTYAGNSVWRRVLHHPSAERVVDVAVDANGDLYFAGAATEDYSGVVGKLRADGDDDPGFTDVHLDFRPRALVQDDQGRLVVAGVDSDGRGVRDVALARFTADGAVLDDRRIRSLAPGPDEGAFALLFADGAIHLAADTRTQALTGENGLDENGSEVPCANIHLLRLEDDLSIGWERTYTNVYDDQVRSLQLAEDGTFLVGGCTDTRFLVTGDDARGKDGWLLKIEKDGYVGPQHSSYGEAAHSDVLASGRSVPTDLEPGYSADLHVDDTNLRTYDAGLVVDTLSRTNAEDFLVTVEIQGSGRVTDPRHRIDCGTGTCDLRIREGLRVTLQPTPTEGESFLGFGPECPQGTFVVEGPFSCTARFTGAGGGGGGGDTGDPADFLNYWEITVQCDEVCESGESRQYEEVQTVTISFDAGIYTILNYNRNQEYRGIRDGDTLNWSATYTFQGAQWEESGSYQLTETGLNVESRYAWTSEFDSCSGTCSGTGRRY